MKTTPHGLAVITLAAALLTAPRSGHADLYVLRSTSGGASSLQMATNGLVTGETDSGHAYTFDGTNFVDYGLGPFGTDFIGEGVNAAGQVVGYSDDGAGHQVAVYAYNSSSNFASGDPLGGNFSYFLGVSDRINGFGFGDLCGLGTDPTDTTAHAIGYDSATNIYTGFPEPAGTTRSYASKVTNTGAIVGYYYGNDTPGGLNGFLWDQDSGSILSSGTLSEGHFSFILGMNVNTSIACGAADSGGNQYAITWNGSSLTPLPLSNSNEPYDAAYGIRSDDRAVGQGINAADTSIVATLWDGGSVEDLNTVTVNPDGSTPTISLSYAENINEAGQVICYGADASTDRIVRLDPVGPIGITIKGKPKHKKPVKGTITLNMAAPVATSITVLSSNHAALADFTVAVPKGAVSVSYKSPKLSKTSKGQSLTLTASDTGLSASSPTVVIK